LLYKVTFDFKNRLTGCTTRNWSLWRIYWESLSCSKIWLRVSCCCCSFFCNFLHLRGSYDPFSP